MFLFSSLLFLLASGNIKLDLNRIWIPEKGGNRCLWGLNRRLKLNEGESYGGDGECAGVLRWDWNHVSLSCFSTEMDHGCVLCAELFCLEYFCWIWILSYDLILLQVKQHFGVGVVCWLG